MTGAGDVVGDRYRLEREIGRGGMGTVWSAVHTLSGKRVAVKLLRRPDRDDLVRRFLLEARAACAVSHPSLVDVHDVFLLHDGTPAMTMELLEGETLAALLAREGALPAADVVTLFLPLVSGVGALHAAGIVHRDLKPENVFLVRHAKGAARVRVLDFGVAKLASGDVRTTETGVTLGTPAYMAPEQALGARDVDHRADVWAIGAMLYEALSGARPVDGESHGQLLKALLTSAIAPLAALAPEAPEPLTRLADHMLAKEPADRPMDLRAPLATLRALAPEVDVPDVGPPTEGALSPLPDLLPREPDRSPGPTRWPWLLVAVTAGAWLAWTLTRAPATQPSSPPPVAPPAPSGSEAAPPPTTPSAPPPLPSQERQPAAARAAPRQSASQTPPAPSAEPSRHAAPPPLRTGGLIEAPPF